MSLYGALFSGVSGLQSQSSAMGAISDNITNVNTIGYKGTKVNFQTLVTKQTSLTTYSAGGVQSKPRAGIDVQGLLQASTSATDVGISGEGMFVVAEAANPTAGQSFAYTRAGSFKVDEEGYLKNVGGFYMQGWPLVATDNSTQATLVTIGNNVYMKSYKDSAGDTVYLNDNIVSTDHMKPLNLNEIGGTASATQNIRMGANLPSGDAVGTNHRTNVLIYDTLGNSHSLQHTWTKTASNNWDVEITPPEGSNKLSVRDSAGAIYSAMGRLDFETTPATGNVINITAGAGPTTYTFTFSTAADDTTGPDFNIDLDNRTFSQVIDQFATVAESAFDAEFGTTATWSERISGTDSLIFRQNNQVNPITVTGTLATGTVQQQGSTTALSYTVPAVDTGYTPGTTSAITFNGDGTPSAIIPDQIDIDWENGSYDMDSSTSPRIKMFLGNTNLADGMTQLSGEYNVAYITQNGAKFGNYAGVTISADGVVTALFDNGVTRPVFQIPVATFVNYNGMDSVTGNVWIETDFSGNPTIRSPSSGGAGSVNAATLEASTVDLGTEFTTMITTQRAYSAAAKIITTSDEMLAELMNVKR